MINAIIENKMRSSNVSRRMPMDIPIGSDSEIGSCMSWIPKPLTLFIRYKMKTRLPSLVHEASKQCGGVSTPTLLETQNFMTPRYF